MQINHRERVVTAKIVYYGPALGGKTTNLEAIHRFTDPEQKTTLLSLKTEGDRTLFFDLLPFDLGNLLGFRFGFKLYTVPGQHKYGATRKKVLEGADGVVLVADSQASKAEENKKSLMDLRSNLKANGINPDATPLVLQYNKQDLADLLTVKELEADLNLRNNLSFAAIAIRGKGILETLAGIIKEVIHAAVTSQGRGISKTHRSRHQSLHRKDLLPLLRARQAAQRGGEAGTWSIQRGSYLQQGRRGRDSTRGTHPRRFGVGAHRSREPSSRVQPQHRRGILPNPGNRAEVGAYGEESCHPRRSQCKDPWGPGS